MSPILYQNFEKEVYQKYYPLVFANCKRRLVDSNAIEDAVQSTFLMYIREEASIRSHLSSWLYWTSTNVCKVLSKQIKSKNKFLAHCTQNPSIYVDKYAEGKDEEVQIQLKNILEKLPKKKQEMLLMRFFDDMTYRQIALHFKSSEDGVRKMIEHTLNQLKKSLNKKDIVFSALFIDFFNKSSSTKVYIIQNTVKQQTIVQGVQNMLYYAKFKIALLLIACVFLPISVVVVASNKGNDESMEGNLSQSTELLSLKNKAKPFVDDKIENIKNNNSVIPIDEKTEIAPKVITFSNPEKIFNPLDLSGYISIHYKELIEKGNKRSYYIGQEDNGKWQYSKNKKGQNVLALEPGSNSLKPGDECPFSGLLLKDLFDQAYLFKGNIGFESQISQFCFILGTPISNEDKDQVKNIDTFISNINNWIGFIDAKLNTEFEFKLYIWVSDDNWKTALFIKEKGNESNYSLIHSNVTKLFKREFKLGFFARDKLDCSNFEYAKLDAAWDPLLEEDIKSAINKFPKDFFDKTKN